VGELLENKKGDPIYSVQIKEGVGGGGGGGRWGGGGGRDIGRGVEKKGDESKKK